MTQDSTRSTSRDLSQPHGLWVKYFFDRKAALRAVNFIENHLTHQEDPYGGKPFLLQRWQRRMIMKLFGWKHRSTGMRKYRTLFLFLPRKNGKTALAAAIALYLLFADKEQGAQIVCAASNKNQARMLFDTAAGMTVKAPTLFHMGKVYSGSIFMPATRSGFRVLSGKPKGKHGGNIHGAIIDELHEIDSREMVTAITTSSISRKQPLHVYITTAGYDKNSLCYEKYKYAKWVQENPSNDESWLSVIYEADPAKWQDPAEWRRCNPSFDTIMDLDEFTTDFKMAQQIPSYENQFKRLRLNIWTSQDSRAIPMEKWDECVFARELKVLDKKECFLGLDLSVQFDFTAALYLFPPTGARPFYDMIPDLYFPEANIEMRASRLPPSVDLRGWVQRGLVKTTPGEVVDYDVLRRDINDRNKQYRIREIAIDRWNANQLSTQLDGDGFTVVPTGQGFATMSAPTKEMLALILGKKFNHDANEVMRWMADNFAVDIDAAGNMKPSKKKAKEKIDGIVAFIMALSRAMVHARPLSVYNQRGLVTVSVS